jgi:hypothetical protein
VAEPLETKSELEFGLTEMRSWFRIESALNIFQTCIPVNLINTLILKIQPYLSQDNHNRRIKELIVSSSQFQKCSEHRARICSTGRASVRRQRHKVTGLQGHTHNSGH